MPDSELSFGHCFYMEFPQILLKTFVSKNRILPSHSNFILEMKKSHIILLLLIAVAVGVIVAMTGDYTTYANFTQAKAKGKVVSVTGYLAKDLPLVYDPLKDPNHFEFTMYDKEGNAQPVIYKGAKPQDFERSEQLVVKGKIDGEYFRASEILMKCPSKYVNDDITLKEKGATEGEWRTVQSTE